MLSAEFAQRVLKVKTHNTEQFIVPDKGSNYKLIKHFACLVKISTNDILKYFSYLY